MRKALHNISLIYKSGSPTNPTVPRSNSSGQLVVIPPGQIDKDEGRISRETAYSNVSRHSIMVRNLRLGIDYKSKQYDHLSRINEYLNEMITVCRSNTGVKSRSWVIYLQSIISFTETKHLNHPLFGCGVEPPIRVHLLCNGRPQIFEFSICGLLNRAHFRSLIYSGIGINVPTNDFLNSCMTEILEELLIVDDERGKALSMLEEINVITDKKYNIIATPKYDSGRKLKLLGRIFSLFSENFYPKFKNA